MPARAGLCVARSVLFCRPLYPAAGRSAPDGLIIDKHTLPPPAFCLALSPQDVGQDRMYSMYLISHKYCIQYRQKKKKRGEKKRKEEKRNPDLGKKKEKKRKKRKVYSSMPKADTNQSDHQDIITVALIPHAGSNKRKKKRKEKKKIQTNRGKRGGWVGN